MSTKFARIARPEIAWPTGSSECPDPLRTGSDVRRVGRLRLPLAGPYRPWATLYRFPDGRTLWVVRLWDVDRAVRRVYATATVRQWAARQGLVSLVAEVDALLADAAD